MPYYYYDHDGQKQGPYSAKQLRQIAREGAMTPETRIETAEGKIKRARKVRGLPLPEMTDSVNQKIDELIAPLPVTVPIDPNPVPDLNPVVGNPPVKPILVSLPAQQAIITPPNTSVSPPIDNTESHRRLLVMAGVVILLVVCGIVLWQKPGGNQLNDTLKKGIDRDITSLLSLEITDIAAKWTHQSNAAASGEFFVSTNATEKLYQSVDNDTGLQKLGMGNDNEAEFSDALEKYRSLPRESHDKLAEAMPQDMAPFLFYNLLVPVGNEIILTGDVELIKSDNGNWPVVRYPVVKPFSYGTKSFSEEDVVPESKLPQSVHKLDDPQTLKTIQERKAFVGKVNEVLRSQ